MARRTTQRTERVGQQIHEILASLLLFDVSDRRLKRVQITGVEVTTDLKLADVYYIMIDQEDPEPDDNMRDAVERSTGFLRKRLGERLTMKHTPELRFQYDESVQRGRRIESLLDKVLPDEEE